MGDYRTTTGEAPPVSRKTIVRRRLFWCSAILISVGLIVYLGILIKVERYVVGSGYVTTENYAEVRPATMGTVEAILKRTGDFVEEDEVLVDLCADEEKALLEEARRRVTKMEVDLKRRRAEIENELERRQVGIDEQKRNHADAVNIARLQLQNAQTKLKRTQELVERGLKAASAEEDDGLKEQLAQAQLASLLDKDLTIYDTLLQKDRATYNTEISAMQQELKALEDAVRRAEVRVRAKEIRAPIAGQVLRYEFVIGELVRPETVLFEIFGGEKLVLKLRVAERYAAKISAGQRYSALLATYRGLQPIYFTGQVLSLRNVIQAEGRQTYRVAYCDFDAQSKTVTPGTTAEARIYYGHSCLWFYLLNIDS